MRGRCNSVSQAQPTLHDVGARRTEGPSATSGTLSTRGSGSYTSSGGCGQPPLFVLVSEPDRSISAAWPLTVPALEQRTTR